MNITDMFKEKSKPVNRSFAYFGMEEKMADEKKPEEENVIADKTGPDKKPKEASTEHYLSPHDGNSQQARIFNKLKIV